MKKLFLLMSIVGISRSSVADDLNAIITNSEVGLNNGAIDLILSGGVTPYTFQWSGPDGYISSDEDISGLEPGEYCVTVTDYYCGIAALCVIVEEDIASGMANQDSLGLKIFPNPFSKEFSIVFDSPESDHYVFELHDLSGKVVWAEKRLFANGINACHFIVEDAIASGRYEMMIQDEKGNILSRIVVRIR